MKEYDEWNDGVEEKKQTRKMKWFHSILSEEQILCRNEDWKLLVPDKWKHFHGAANIPATVDVTCVSGTIFAFAI